ncbi:unnamed protein product, partial [Mesorhabditis belari]|uniref:RING-type domain-containing protein n=1 Tax=Mesorhabditis belari TaxID=2138241 RepID=A0AAF3EHG5_9BILA
MKVFESLNCILCEQPFVSIANQPRSPRHLNCGLAMCHECFEKEESLEKDERKHQCDSEICFDNPNFAYFLIDVLSSDYLMLSPILGGYLLVRPFKLPECRICQEEYSHEGEKSSRALSCNHILCTECYLKTRVKEEEVEEVEEGEMYTIKCPLCNGTFRDSTFGDSKRDRLQDFLKELPKMTQQLEDMGEAGQRFCDECAKVDSISEMFHCNECTLQLCGTCTYKKHHQHETMVLLQEEVNQVSDKLREVSNGVINTYELLFPDLHKELHGDIEGFKQKLLDKERALRNVPTFEDLKKKRDKCTKLKTDFEMCSEEYIPHLRKYGAIIKELIQSLDDVDDDDDKGPKKGE